VVTKLVEALEARSGLSGATRNICIYIYIYIYIWRIPVCLGKRNQAATGAATEQDTPRRTSRLRRLRERPGQIGPRVVAGRIALGMDAACPFMVPVGHVDPR